MDSRRLALRVGPAFTGVLLGLPAAAAAGESGADRPWPIATAKNREVKINATLLLKTVDSVQHCAQCGADSKGRVNTALSARKKGTVKFSFSAAELLPVRAQVWVKR